MSLDCTRLEKARLRGDKLIARCPACAEQGADRSGEHLFIADQGHGAFGCIAHQGDKEHTRRIFELVGVQEARCPAIPLPSRRLPPAPKSPPRIPPLRPLTVAEMACIAELRGWHHFAGLQLLSNRGLLFFGEVWDAGHTWPAWIITDSSRRNAQARRMDGYTWEGIGEAKAKSLPGTDPSWPIGAAEIGDCPVVVITEGQPDFCAALLVAWAEEIDAGKLAPVCMTGAGNRIHPDALPRFHGRHVRIAMQNDAAGQEAAHRWASQLYEAGAGTVDAFDFAGLSTEEGHPIKDLAEFARLLGPENTAPVRAFSGLPQLTHPRRNDGSTSQQQRQEITQWLQS